MKDALAIRKQNMRSEWHQGGSNVYSDNPDHAATRIYGDYADIQPHHTGPRLKATDSVFAMGSCFAREVELALSYRGANIVSIDNKLLNRPEFQDKSGQVRWGFFHRFTPRAMLHEFMIAFNRQKDWDPEKSLLVEHGGDVIDLNYWNVEGSDLSLAANLTRRAVARQLVRRAATADVVILTLGMTEGWIHTPTGFHVNRFSAKLARKASDFEFHNQDYAEVLQSLRQIHKLLTQRRKKPFQFVVTVSPVPLAVTFTANDIVQANMQSKSTLRAAASAFAEEFDNVSYFPSYEMVVYSNPKRAWRPDRLHVNSGMVNHIVSKFADVYYEPGSLREPRRRIPSQEDDA